MADASLAALNEALFAQLEVLKNPSLKGEKLREELDRTKGLTGLSSAIANNGKLMLHAARMDDATAVSSIMHEDTARLLCVDN